MLCIIGVVVDLILYSVVVVVVDLILDSVVFAVVDLILDSVVASGQLDALNRDKVQDSLLMKHRHQHQRREGKGIPMIRSLADIGRKMSARNFGESKGIVC